MIFKKKKKDKRFLSLIKVIYKKPTGNFTLSSGRLKAFPISVIVLTTSFQYHTRVSSLCKQAVKRNKINFTQ